MCPAERDPADRFKSELDTYHLPGWKADPERYRKFIKKPTSHFFAWGLTTESEKHKIALGERNLCIHSWGFQSITAFISPSSFSSSLPLYLLQNFCFEEWCLCSPTGSLCDSVYDILKKNAGRWHIQNRTEHRHHWLSRARWSCSGHHEPQVVCVRLQENESRFDLKV